MAKSAINHRPRRSGAKTQSNKNTLETFKRLNYKITFDTAIDAIDLRTMAENYGGKRGIIPLNDIQQLLRIMLGAKYGTNVFNHDPSNGVLSQQMDASINPQFKYVDWDEMYLWTLFQRDVMPNHIKSIYNDFDPSCVIVPCAIKVTVNGKVHYCIWDGHHTLQVCRLQGYNKFGIWFIDIDKVPAKVIHAAGKSKLPNVVTDAERIQYGVWLAGRNMIRINARNKRKLSHYDQFMIEVETEDKRAVAINKILVQNNCVPKRHAGIAGALTQFRTAIECYELEKASTGTLGLYLDRALQFHRKYWPQSPIILEVFRPLAILYWEAEHVSKKPLDAQFDVELGKLLRKKFGHADGVQVTIKDSYQEAIKNGDFIEEAGEHDRRRVLSGIINLYDTEIGRARLPDSKYEWDVMGRIPK